MASESGYNGWANWETWNVALWVDNEEGLYREKERLVRRTTADRLPRALEEWVKEVYPNGTPDFKGEGGKRCYDKVDWEEIANAWKGEQDE